MHVNSKNAPPASGKYDFSAIYLVQQDMRKSFRNLSIQQQRFEKQLEKNHNKFFQTVLQNKRQLYFGKLSLEGGAQMESTGLKSKIQRAGQKNQNRDQSNDYLKNEQIERLARQSRRPKSSIIVDDYTHKLPKDQQNEKQQAQDDIEGFDYISALQAELQQEKIQDYRVRQKEKLNEDDIQADKDHQIAKQKRKQRQQTIEMLLSKEKCSQLGLQQFKNTLKDEELLLELSKKILDDFYKQNTTFKLTDNQLTLDQFKTRIYERIQKKTDDQKYYCLDDLKQILGDNLITFDPTNVDEYIKMIYQKDIKDLTAKESNLKLEPWQTNQKCLRSIYNLGVKIQSKQEKRRKRKQSHETHYKTKTLDEKTSARLSQSSSKKLNSGRGKKKIHTTSILTNVNNVKKKDAREFTEKIKETLKIFHNLKAKSEKEEVYRNYGPTWEIEQNEERKLQVQFQKPEEDSKSDKDNKSKYIHHHTLHERVQDVRTNCGFLKKLDEIGANVKMDQEVNELLYLEDKEKDKKEQMLEDFKKSVKKLRPREIFDIEAVIQQRKDNLRLRQQTIESKSGNNTNPNYINQSQISQEYKETILNKSNMMGDTQSLFDQINVELYELKLDEQPNREWMSKAKRGTFYTEKSSIIPKPLKKSMIGGFKFNCQNHETSKMSDSFSQATTAAADENYSVAFGQSGNRGRKVRPSTSVKPQNSLYYSINSQDQYRKIGGNYNQGHVIEEEFDMNNQLQSTKQLNKRQMNKSLVSDKFLSYLNEVGIPISKSNQYGLMSSLNPQRQEFKANSFQTQAMVYRINQKEQSCGQENQAFNTTILDHKRIRLESANLYKSYQENKIQNRRKINSWHMANTNKSQVSNSAQTQMNDSQNETMTGLQRSRLLSRPIYIEGTVISPNEWKQSTNEASPIKKVESFNIDMRVDQQEQNDQQRSSLSLSKIDLKQQQQQQQQFELNQ
ncbi:UNKNOWN [Stylonychia lemnae]|uniref:Uncharacterized protein n=1 Tax=Stylonychia lemnae TaxID=5949 RepID=A0A078AKY7_STYLE|nr:UNKNOWN [Stylonychia lemnae]|eukprot:CDW82102.1 UNKNOWN [Stylonychia lemnae]